MKRVYMKVINNQKLITTGTIIFLSFICVVCSIAEDIINSSTNINILLEVRAPFSKAMVSIDNNGNIQYKEILRRDGKPCDSYTKHVSRKGVEEITKFIIEKGFFKLGTNYKEEKTDMSHYVITVTINEKTKSVTYYGYSRYSEIRELNRWSSGSFHSKVPTALYEIKDKIEELLGREILEVGV